MNNNPSEAFIKSIEAQNKTPDAATLIRNIDELAAQPPRQPAQPPRQPALGEGAQMVHDAARKNIDIIFEHATARIATVRRSLEAMETSLTTKRASLTESLRSYVATLEMIEQQARAMDAAISDAVVAQDGVG